MKARSHALAKTTSALILALIMMSLFPVAALASGSHDKFSYDKIWTSKSWFKSDVKKARSGKKCSKKQCDTSLSVPLYVEGDKRIGKVTVRLENGDLKVRYQVKEGWYIKQTHLDLSENLETLHFNADGSPNLKAYPYKSKHFTPVKSADYTINANQWPLGTGLFIAAHAVVVNKSNGKCKQHSAKSRRSNSHDNRHGKKRKQRKSHSKKGHSDHDDFYNRKSDHHKYDRKHHDHIHGKTIELDAWAIGEKFYGQELAGYFIYKLESCDPVQQSTIQFSDALYTVSEEGPAAVITVVRSGNLDLEASVEFTTVDGSAINGADYEFATGIIDFAPGQTTAQFEVMPIDDVEVEGVETVSLQLSNPLGATLGLQNMATLEIDDNDAASLALIAIDRIEPNPVDEGATVIIYVTRTGDVSVDATVEFGTIDGSAIGSTQCGPVASPVPFDYEQTGGTLFFDAGISELSIEVITCNNNPRDDTDETFDIEIYNPVGAELADDGDGNPHSNLETVTIIEGS